MIAVQLGALTIARYGAISWHQVRWSKQSMYKERRTAAPGEG